MKRYLFLFTLVLILAGINLQAEGGSRPLSLDDCISIALDQNPSARAAQEGVNIAQESIGIARAPYYPEFNINASYNRFQTHLFFPPIKPPIPNVTISIPSILGPFNDWHFVVNSRYILYDFGLRRATLLEAKAQSGLAREEEARIQQEIILNVSLAYYGLLADLELLDVARQSLHRSEDHAQLARDRHKAGTAPYSDLLRAQVDTANARQYLVKSESTVRIARGNLNAYMGLPPETSLEIKNEKDEFASPKGIDLCEAMQYAVADRPETNAALHKIVALRNRIDQAKAAFGPKVYAAGAYGRRDDEFWPKDQDWYFGVWFELPLFQGFETTHSVQRAEAQLHQEEAEYDRLVLSVKQDVWKAYSHLLEAYENIQAALAQVKDAKESLRLVDERYKVGSSIITDLLDVETANASSQANLVDARWSYRSAYSLFLWAQGK